MDQKLTVHHFNNAQDYIDVTDTNKDGYVTNQDTATAKQDFLTHKKGDAIQFDDEGYKSLRVVTTLNPNLDQPLDQFVAKIDYDFDILSDGGCHGTDPLFNDSPIRFNFTVYVSGEVKVSAVRVSEYSQDLPEITLTPDNKLYEWHYNNPRYLIQDFVEIYTYIPIPPHESLNGRDIRTMSITKDFATCATDSEEFNTDLTSGQKAIVERFFSAAGNLGGSDSAEAFSKNH